MIEKIQNEYDLFEKKKNYVDETLLFTILTDIAVYLVDIEKKDNKVIKNYEKLDKAIMSVKEVLNELIDKPQINLLDSLQNDINFAKDINTESEYSMRTLKWVLDELNEKKEEKEKEENA